MWGTSRSRCAPSARCSRAARPLTSFPAPPSTRRQPTSAARGRMLIAAMAAGAAAAAAYTVVNPREQVATRTVLAAEKASMDGRPARRLARSRGGRRQAGRRHRRARRGTLAHGAAYAAERAEREARLQRPLPVMPTHAIFTSGFGYRWGALHDGGPPARSAPRSTRPPTASSRRRATPTRLRRLGPDHPPRRHRDPLRPHQQLERSGRPAGLRRRPDRDHRQPRQLHRSASALRRCCSAAQAPPTSASWLAARGISVGPYVG